MLLSSAFDLLMAVPLRMQSIHGFMDKHHTQKVCQKYENI